MIRLACVRNRKGLSLPVIILSGVIAAFFMLVAFVIVRHMLTDWSPTRKNVERLLEKRKYRDALTLLGQKDFAARDSSEFYLMQGIVWMSLAWERENREKWRNYGKDEGDWFKSPEAQQAYAKLKQALRINPENADAHYYMALLCIEKGWYSNAESELLEVLRLDNEHVRTRINLGVVYSLMHQYAMAEKELLRAYKLDPDNPKISKNLAFLYRFHMDRPEDALEWGNRYMNMVGDNDFDVNVMREEMTEMLERYPELTPEEPLHWKTPPEFKARKSTPFTRGKKKATR